MTRIKVLYFLLLLIPFIGTAQNKKHKEAGKDKNEQNNEASINWMSLEQAQEAMKKTPKKILVDVYTDWCGPCKMMMKNTFTDPEIIKYINEKYYAVKFNAEGPDSVLWKGQSYKNPEYNPEKQGRNATHQLTYNIALFNGNIAYPTLVYIDENLNVLTPVQGYFQPSQLEPIIHFFGDDSYKTTNWDEFNKTFKGKIAEPNELEGYSPYKLNWMTFPQALNYIQVAPKKIFVDVYTDWCGWCKKMDASTFTHPVIVELLNKYFYTVKLDAEMKDSLNIGGKIYVNPDPNSKRSTHEIAKTLLNNKLTYPTVVYLDETGNILSPVAGYLTPKDMEPILVFFGENHHKTTTYEEFIKTFKGRIQEN